VFPGVCFGTPSLRNGKLALGQIKHVAREIAAAICQKKIDRNVWRVEMLLSSLAPKRSCKSQMYVKSNALARRIRPRQEAAIQNQGLSSHEGCALRAHP